MGLLASTLAGLATGIGAIPTLFRRDFSEEFMDTMLGFSAGIMLATTFISLLGPAIEQGNPIIAIIVMIIGALLIHLVDIFVPHFHPVAGPEGPPSRISKILLIIIAIIIHNFPEGLAVGVSFSFGGIVSGLPVAIAIAVQNVPEGLMVALPLLREKIKKSRVAGYTILTGLVEPLGGAVGILALYLIHGILPYTLAFVAGAMMFVVIDEMIPESHKKGFGRRATFGFFGGFSIMIIIESFFA